MGGLEMLEIARRSESPPVCYEIEVRVLCPFDAVIIY